MAAPARSMARAILRRPSQSIADSARPSSTVRRPRPEQAAAEAAVRLAERLLSEARDELRRADARAAQWLTTFGGGLMAMLTVLVGAGRRPWHSSGLPGWAWWAGCASAAVALCALLLALVPRTGGPPESRHVAYFGHIHRLRDPEVVRRHVEAAARDNMPGLIAELCWISRLVMTKYRSVRIGTLFIALAAALLALGLR